jgi:phenylpropionate dioxygenase-like ring-hydroxylating dioxygenase large terminal subunit
MKTYSVDDLVTRDAHGNVIALDHRIYTDEEIYRAELEKIFGRLWVFVGLELEIPQPGDFKTTYVGQAPVVVVRDEDGRLHAYENVCPHRGAKVVRQAYGCAKVFRCLYHQWTFTLQGQLIGVPLETGFRGTLNKEMYGLPRIPRVETFAGLIFVSYDREAIPLAEYLNEIAIHVNEMLRGGAVEFLGFQRYHVRSNWKLFIENTIDAYHPGLLHMPIQRGGYAYRPGVGSNHTFPHGHGLIKWPLVAVEHWDPTRDMPLIAKTRRDGWDRVLNIFPNAMVLEIEDILTVRHLLPRGVDKVDVITYNLAPHGESEELKRHRAWMVSSQFGIAGVASLDDKLVMEAIQDAAHTRYTKTILLRGDPETSQGDLTDEISLRGFYQMWAWMMQ